MYEDLDYYISSMNFKLSNAPVSTATNIPAFRSSSKGIIQSIKNVL